MRGCSRGVVEMLTMMGCGAGLTRSSAEDGRWGKRDGPPTGPEASSVASTSGPALPGEKAGQSDGSLPYYVIRPAPPRLALERWVWREELGPPCISPSSVPGASILSTWGNGWSLRDGYRNARPPEQLCTKMGSRLGFWAGKMASVSDLAIHLYSAGAARPKYSTAQSHADDLYCT